MARGSPRPDERRPGAVHTFLIADIRGFTDFTNRLGDEAVGRLATKFAQVTGEAVEAWGGELLELRGDEALCMFGSPRAALRCAVELQDAYIDETRLDPILPLNAGIGLDAGEAVPVGDGFRGSALNLAARLCAAAEAGQVIATDGIVHLAGPMDGLSYASLGGKSLKGFHEPVPAWLVTAERPHDHLDGIVQPTSSGILPAELDAIVPLAGRESDLRWLGWHWRQARHGHGSIVTLSGPSGIGRTRVVAEIAVLAQGQGAAVRYLRADDEADLPGGSTLVVLDDLDRVPATRAEALLAGLAPNDDQRLVIVTHGDDPPTALARSLDRLVPPERRRRLSPLDADAVSAIARLYFERPDEDPPTQLLLEESDGIPAAVHRVASQWARAAAARRLGDSARRTSRERRDLRAAEEQMIDDAARLELARDRSRLFVELDEAAAGQAAAPTVTVCPYKGLAAFEAADADYYFGRERLVAELIARIVGSAFVGLVGASGSGKSSALQAGLLPGLAHGVLPGSDEWIQVPMRPGEQPMRAFHRALTRAAPEHGAAADPRAALTSVLHEMRPAQRLLLVIDQFEELFAAVDEAERSAFIDLITEPRTGLKVLVALRADHYARCAAYPRLARTLATDQVLVGPLTASEIEGVIQHPAERVGLRVEPDLVKALVSDVGIEPGGLPLLSTALLELWEAREDGRLTLAAYRATGGVRGAVARMAENAYKRLAREEQIAARFVCLRLIAEGESGIAVRRRVRADELGGAEDPRVAGAVRKLTDARLLSASDGYVELAHEALLAEWPRLKEWIQDEGAERQLRMHLATTAREWEEGDRDPGDLYRGLRLAAALEGASAGRLQLNRGERTFLEESRLRSEAEAERQRRANQILRSLLAGVGAFLILAVLAGAFAAAQATRAEEEAAAARRNAERAETEEAGAAAAADLARARELAASAIATVDSDPQLSILLALEATATGTEPAPEAITSLHRAVQSSRARLTIPVVYGADAPRPDAIGVRMSNDGSRLFVQSNSSSVRIYDADTGRHLGALGDDLPDAQPNHHLGIALSRDGAQVAIVDERGIAHVWTLDGDRSRPVSTQAIPTAGVGTNRGPVFSYDGSKLATVVRASESFERGTVVQVWDLASARELVRQEVDAAAYALFDPDGQHLLIPTCCSDAHEVWRMDVATGELVKVVTGPFLSADLSPDGRFIATGGLDRVANVWDVSTGKHVVRLAEHRDVIGDVAFSPDGARLATASQDGLIRVWSVPTGDLEMTLAGQAGLIWALSWTQDGARLASGSAEGGVTIWDTSPSGGGSSVGAHDLGVARILDIATAGNRTAILGAERLVGGLSDSRAIVLDLDDGVVVLDLDARAGVGVALTAGGTKLWSQAAFEDTFWGGVTEVEVASGITVGSLAGFCERPGADPTCSSHPPNAPWTDQIARIAASPDGSMVATLSLNAVAVWDTATGQLTAVVVPRWLGQVGLDQFGIAFSEDGAFLAVSTTEGLVVFDVRGLRSMDRAQMLALDAQLVDALEAALGEQTEDVLELTASLRAMLPIVTTLPVTGAWRVEFSPSGDYLAVASPVDGTHVFETVTWRQRHTLPSSWDVDIHPDDETLAILATDGTASVWTLDGGELLQTIPVVSRGLGVNEGALRWAANGRHLLATDGGILMVHTTDVEELVQIARSRLTRELTPRECATYRISACGIPRSSAEPEQP
ncbi:MAG TPA: hypothetical protein VF365_10635 [Candidatus Limnocylindria bacterium]